VRSEAERRRLHAVLGGFFANDFAKLFQIRVFSEYLISNFWRYQF